MPPLQTFLDDPLRVLRAVRFASRYQFEVDPDLRTAAKSFSYVSAARKVSRERMAKELSKMIHGPFPHLAVKQCQELCLLEVAMEVPAGADPEVSPAAASILACAVLDATMT